MGKLNKRLSGAPEAFSGRLQTVQTTPAFIITPPFPSLPREHLPSGILPSRHTGVPEHLCISHPWAFAPSALCGHILYRLSHQGSPRILEWVAYPLFQGIFLTQESNQGLLHCRRILYQLSY